MCKKLTVMKETNVVKCPLCEGEKEYLNVCKHYVKITPEMLMAEKENFNLLEE